MEQDRFFIQDLEVALGVNRTTLFYWEKTGKIPKAKRTPMGNYRYWTKSEVEKIKRKIHGK